MLRKAGWQPGMGLGAEGQGPTAPIALAEQSGRRGIGAKEIRSQQQPQSSRGNKAKGSAAQEGITQRPSQPARHRQPALPKAETLDVKVRCHRQVQQAKEDEASNQEISRCGRTSC